MLDLYGTERHYIDHLDAVRAAIPASGFVTTGALRADPERPILVAASGDLTRARAAGRRHIALMEHGYGQSYAGNPTSGAALHASYPGGRNRTAELFLSPNEHAASRDRAAYPDARVVVVGSPKVDTLPRREANGEAGPVIAVSFHWDAAIAPETHSTFAEYRDAVAALAKERHVIGHAHPREIDRLAGWYERRGIEVVRDFRDVLRRADLYVCDNSSTLYEFASTGRPVVVLNGSFYRRQVSHGLRFWEAATVGVQVDDPNEFADAVTHALVDPPAVRDARDRALLLVYAYRGDAATRAATALRRWIGDSQRENAVAAA